MADALDFTMKSQDGQDVPLSRYRGNAVLMVNVASRCGLTPQYRGLQALHEKYAARGLAVLGFPANDFGQQEPGSDAEIKQFCHTNYGVGFDMFSKVAVTGDQKCPLYRYLTSEETDPGFSGEVQWNFAKFLIGRDGSVVARFDPGVDPESPEITAAIEAALSGE
jgi:glutathione peroxidase